MAFGNPAAYMGFVGFARFNIPNNTTVVRATSADVKLTQEITKPDVIDSRFDRTLYQLGPKIVEGGIEFPAIFDSGTTQNISDVAKALYERAVHRDYYGKLTLIDIDLKYSFENASFLYPNCVINNWRFSVDQSDIINLGVDIIGGVSAGEGRIPKVFTEPTAENMALTRICTWNDAVFRIFNADYDLDIGGEWIRHFEVEIANDAERFYTLNGLLLPQDISPRKREITGNIVIMGRHPTLGSLAKDNQTRCTEATWIKFGYQISNTQCGSGFYSCLPNTVFQIEEIALTNDIFETTVNYHNFPVARQRLENEQYNFNLTTGSTTDPDPMLRYINEDPAAFT